ncbi:alpha/beta hydrolase family esterase [Aestuariibius insulae]|uniref:alpha/beta hydrolase family esterase n=1 Tax=Aestuariibius insulae TaxID=2058287 RepID=UPI00347CBC88
MRITTLLAALGCLSASPALAGCAGEETACEIEGGQYHIVLPDDADGPLPALMFLHGWGSSGEGVLRNRNLVEAALARGYAVIAPDGLPREGANGRSWSFHPERAQRRDEIGFLTQVRDDVARHGVDVEEISLGGFSIGGSMVTYLACAAPETFAVYLPVGGSFWRPHPDMASCGGPVRLLHTHGWTDGTVPLEGRLLRGESWQDADAVVQGDVFYAMEIWRATNGCAQSRPDTDRFVTDDYYLRRAWMECSEGSALELAIFPGGHTVPRGWADFALDWVEAF